MNLTFQCTTCSIYNPLWGALKGCLYQGFEYVYTFGKLRLISKPTEKQFKVQWGSGIWPFKIQIFWTTYFKWSSFSEGGAIAIALTIWKLDHSESVCFLQISNGFWQNGDQLCGVCYSSHQSCNLSLKQPMTWITNRSRKPFWTIWIPN